MGVFGTQKYTKAIKGPQRKNKIQGKCFLKAL